MRRFRLLHAAALLGLFCPGCYGSLDGSSGATGATGGTGGTGGGGGGTGGAGGVAGTGGTSGAGGTPMADLASSMPSRTWAELATSDIGPAFLNTGGSSGFIIGYAESMRWDPISRQVFYLGSDHGGAYRFVAYAEIANRWTVLPQPPWSMVAPPAYADAHGYDQLAINPPARQLYRRPYNANRIHVYDIDTGVWTVLPDPPFFGEYGSCCDAIEYFPELGGLVWSRGYDSVWLFGASSQQWSLLGDRNGISGTWVFAEYNPVRGVMILGSAAGGYLFKLSSAGLITRQRDLPVSIYDGSAWNGVVTVDPAGGDYLVLTAPDHRLHLYDVLTDSWMPAPSQPPADLADGGLVAAPIATYGITMFTHCKSGACRVLLYKN